MLCITGFKYNLRVESVRKSIFVARVFRALAFRNRRLLAHPLALQQHRRHGHFRANQNDVSSTTNHTCRSSRSNALKVTRAQWRQTASDVTVSCRYIFLLHNVHVVINYDKTAVPCRTSNGEFIAF